MAGDNVVSRSRHRRILHLAYESVFVARFAELIEEAAPHQSDFLVLAPNAGGPKYPIRQGHVWYETDARACIARASELLPSYDVVIVHYLHPFWGKALSKVEKRTVVVWSGFGGDYYDSRSADGSSLFLPETLKAVAEVEPRQRTSPVASMLRWYGSNQAQRFKKAAVRRADFFSAPIPTDYPVMLDRHRGFRGSYAQLNYGTAGQMAPEGKVPTGNSVLLGNSGGPENNHIDMFELLAEELGERQLIVPLSYGATHEYRDAVISAGNRLFGDRFAPLTDMLPLQEYNEIIAGCSDVIMGHRRQQGLGNIVAALLGGARVHLHKDNPVFSFLEGHGVLVGSLEHLDLSSQTQSSEARERQQQVVAKFWGESIVVENIRAMLLKADALRRTGERRVGESDGYKRKKA